MPCRRGMWCWIRTARPVRTSEFVTCVATMAHSGAYADGGAKASRTRLSVPRTLSHKCVHETSEALRAMCFHVCRRKGAVIVIGAGISGVATALELQKYGFEVASTHSRMPRMCDFRQPPLAGHGAGGKRPGRRAVLHEGVRPRRLRGHGVHALSVASHQQPMRVAMTDQGGLDSWRGEKSHREVRGAIRVSERRWHTTAAWLSF